MRIMSLNNLLKEKRVTVSVIQTLLAVEDDEIICYGYGMKDGMQFRYTVWFEDGKLCRTSQLMDHDNVFSFWASKLFDARFFHQEVTCWYEECTNSGLRNLFHTFGNPLPEIVGGKKPDVPPDVTDYDPFMWS